MVRLKLSFLGVLCICLFHLSIETTDDQDKTDKPTSKPDNEGKKSDASCSVEDRQQILTNISNQKLEEHMKAVVHRLLAAEKLMQQSSENEPRAGDVALGKGDG